MDHKILRQTDEDVVILPGARVSGDVTMGHGCSVWYNAVIRGDEAPIAVGENTNIQDNCTLHTSYGHPPVSYTHLDVYKRQAIARATSAHTAPRSSSRAWGTPSTPAFT